MEEKDKSAKDNFVRLVFSVCSHIKSVVNIVIHIMALTAMMEFIVTELIHFAMDQEVAFKVSMLTLVLVRTLMIDLISSFRTRSMSAM